MAVNTTVVECVVKGHVVLAGGGLKPIVNVFHYGIGAPALIGDFTNFRTAFVANHWAPIATALNTSYVGDSILVRPMDDATVPYQALPGPTNGAVAGDRLPTDDAVYLEIQTAKRGRSFRGSKHFTPLSESDTTLDELAGAGLARWTAVQTALSGSFTDGDGNVWTLGVLSRKPPAQYSVNPTTIVFTPKKTMFLNLTVGTMRRRREKTVRQ